MYIYKVTLMYYRSGTNSTYNRCIISVLSVSLFIPVLSKVDVLIKHILYVDYRKEIARVCMSQIIY